MPNAVARHQYPTRPESVALAREDCRTFLADWVNSAACNSVGDDLALITSELVGNAVRHAPNGAPVGYLIERSGDLFRIEVRDRGRNGKPEIRQPNEWIEGGRGLFLVDALAQEWGVREEVIGVTVWAVVKASEATCIE